MYNKRYKGGDRVPEGGTRFYIMRQGSHVATVKVEVMYFPPLLDPNLYYIKAC